MSWSTSAPNLPAGVSWSAYKNGARDNDHSNPNYDFRVRARWARGQGSTLYVHIQIQAILRVYGAVASIAQLRGAVSVGDGDWELSSSYSGHSTNYEDWFTVKNVYWTGEAASAQKVHAAVRQNQNYSPQLSFDAPAQLSIPVWVNDAGAVRQVTAAYANVDGAIRQCEVWANAGGAVRKIG